MSAYDVIVIGTGAGGGTLLARLATSGLRILVLERGGFLKREPQNWDSAAVFVEGRYHTRETWDDRDGRPFHPQVGYNVGGNTKVYGAALFRLRERDFTGVQHGPDLMSRRWPVGYDEFEPYYGAAERLYRVHGQTGDDPSEPRRTTDYPAPPVSDEPHIAGLRRALQQRGLRPFYIPLGVDLDERDPLRSACIRCATCDGFPCLLNAKSDADTVGVRPALGRPNVELITDARVTKILTDPAGRAAIGVEVGEGADRQRYFAAVVVVAAGAVNSAALLLRSASDHHPDGLANGSGQVGRNFMKHHNAMIVAVGRAENPTVFQKTLAVNDFYAGEPGFERPMGHVQLLGKLDAHAMAGGAPAIVPTAALRLMARHSTDWWLTAEDLPEPGNRVRLAGNRIVLEYTPQHTAGLERLLMRWKATLKALADPRSLLPEAVYLQATIPLAGVGHQCGTCVFGDDPRTSVLDRDCRAHEVEGLYVVDASFFPSSGAVNPSLTIMANALRVGDRILEHLGASAPPLTIGAAP